MDSYEEVLEALESEKLSKALFKLGIFSRNYKNPRFKGWLQNEIEGYQASLKYTIEETGYFDYFIPKHRFVCLEKDDEEGSFLEFPVLDSIVTLEKSITNGLAANYPSYLLYQSVKGEKEFIISEFIPPEQISILIEQIRNKAIYWLLSFLASDTKLIYPSPGFEDLVKDQKMAELLESRWVEANLNFQNGAYLSTTVMLGSLLEGILLDTVKSHPRDANQSELLSKKKDDPNKKHPNELSLSDLIQVAYDCGWIKNGVDRFCHSLRDYRNFIHPRKHLDEKNANITREICEISWTVIKAAIYDLKVHNW